MIEILVIRGLGNNGGTETRQLVENVQERQLSKVHSDFIGNTLRTHLDRMYNGLLEFRLGRVA